MDEGETGIGDFFGFGGLQVPPCFLLFEFGFDDGGALGCIGMSRAGIVLREHGMGNPDCAGVFA